MRDQGVGGRPTLVQNVESLAHVALIARFGAQWFRSIGTPDSPGTSLFTVTGRWAEPRIVEVPLGVPMGQFLGLGAGDAQGVQGVLLGGYGGGWLPTAQALAMPMTEEEARRHGSSLGAGVLALLPADVCPLAEVSRVARYMDGQKAGQCGPVHQRPGQRGPGSGAAGLPAPVAAGRRGAHPAALRPDGGTGGVRPPRRRGPVRAHRPVGCSRTTPSSTCSGARATGPAAPSCPCRPIGPAGRDRRPVDDGAARASRYTLVVDPIACDGHGVCAELLPERIRLDPWGFPIIEAGPGPHPTCSTTPSGPSAAVRGWR